MQKRGYRTGKPNGSEGRMGQTKMTAEAFAAAAAGPRMGKHHGSEERRNPKIAPRTCLT